jgi:hypothetical protein
MKGGKVDKKTIVVIDPYWNLLQSVYEPLENLFDIKAFYSPDEFMASDVGYTVSLLIADLSHISCSDIAAEQDLIGRTLFAILRKVGYSLPVIFHTYAKSHKFIADQMGCIFVKKNIPAEDFIQTIIFLADDELMPQESLSYARRLAVRQQSRLQPGDHLRENLEQAFLKH